MSQLQFRNLEREYQSAVARIREKLLLLPEDIIDLAYRFRDLCEDVGSNFNYEQEFKVQRQVEIDHSMAIYANYTIRVVSEWESGYQDQTWQNKVLSIDVTGEYLPKGFRCPQVLEWNKEQNEKL